MGPLLKGRSTKSVQDNPAEDATAPPAVQEQLQCSSVKRGCLCVCTFVLVLCHFQVNGQ